LSSRTDRLRADSDTFGDLIGRGAEKLLKPTRTLVQPTLFDPSGEEIETGEDDRSGTAARNRLMRYGLMIRAEMDPTSGAPTVVLIVANSHRQLAEMFAQSVWRTLPEAATGGGWSQVLRRAPGAQPTRFQVRFRAGVRSRAVILPIDLVLGGDTAEDAMPRQDPAEIVDITRPGDVPLH